MRLDVAVYDVELVAVADGVEYLPHVVAGDRLRVDEAGQCSLLDLEAKIGSVHAD